ncbi:stage III sporulation protein AA [Oceanirhabdus sp. W0125-5]|uniref:stage III sporulation protein AA n=1 Tax=Oceanirhabdus sp. W0125-5 TaxID=2999116 RepID=UPI0022F323D0|nr:stage III sporulation protein AA [Oceanirhabdus sp. W0125-5]WBW95335.1 stage III sporulation protein AA [Oceanirhabdus sp. W0125-5]
MIDEFMKVLSPEIFAIVKTCVKSIQEIRVRCGKNLVVITHEGEKRFDYIVTQYDIDVIVRKISQFSRYAFNDEIKQGFITIKGGHRVGLCGSCVLEKGEIKTLRNISSLNIRRANEIIGASDKVINEIMTNDVVNNAIIISPPRCGKTTLLRDLARVISDKYKLNVCIIDERGEIGACSDGIPQLNVGSRTDVFDRCPKSKGIMLAIRSLSPDVIICDEIGTDEDMISIIMAVNSGVKIITSIHGFDVEDLYKKKVYSRIIEHKVFKRAIILNNLKKVGDITSIVDLDKGKGDKGA